MAKNKGPGVKSHHVFYVVIMVIGTHTSSIPCLGGLDLRLCRVCQAGLCPLSPCCFDAEDFFLNIIFTICGYIPGHLHNFYIQNIRNNEGRNRTPKWAIKYGLVHVKDKKAKAKHQWQHRYAERNPRSNYTDADSVTGSGNGTWDGRGPEPPPKPDVARDRLERSQFDSRPEEERETFVDQLKAMSGTQIPRGELDDEAEDIVDSGSRRSRREDTEESFDPAREHDWVGGSVDQDNGHSAGGGGRKKGIKAVLGGGPAKKADRFDRIEAGRQEQDDLYRRKTSSRKSSANVASDGAEVSRPRPVDPGPDGLNHTF